MSNPKKRYRGLPMTDLVSLAAMLTNLGDYHVLVAISIAFALVVRPGDVRPLVLTLGAIVLVTALKTHFAVPRPPGATAGGYAFPSGHATVSLVTYASIALLEDRSIGWRTTIAALLGSSIALTRVIIGVHYWSDIIAGLLLATAVLGLAFGLSRYLKPKFTHD
ncbi:phosphatase PAP2 family protein [Saliphagus sp. GCM10025308]